MRIRDIKVGMTVRVKANANALTTNARNMTFMKDNARLISVQGLTGVVQVVDDDNTIKVFIWADDEYVWLNPIHLEATNVNVIDPVEEVEVKPSISELQANIAKLKSELDAAVKDFETFNNKFSIENIFSGNISDGVYTISGSDGKCVITKGVPLWVTSYIIQPLDRRVWKDSIFTLTKMKPSITFN